MHLRRTVTAPTAWVALLWLCSGILYSLWLLGPWLNQPLDELNGYVSEYAASDQPGRLLFRTGDTLTGILATASVLVGARSAAGGWERAGWAGVAVFGITTLVDGALTPMDCATYVDTGCAARELVGAVSAGHEIHAVTSSLAITGALLGMFGLGLAARSKPGVGLAAGWTLVVFGVTAAATTATLVALLAGAWAGVAQRFQVAGIAVWFVSSAVVRLRHRPGGDPHARDPAPTPRPTSARSS